MSYVTVSFEIHEEDFVPGLKVKFLNVPTVGGLVPFTHGDHQAAVHVEREGDLVDVTLHGGTRQQFIHHVAAQAEYAKRHGLTQGDTTHCPRRVRDAA